METLGKLYLKELETEAVSARKCIERIPLEQVFDWKPHEKSMQMGYLTILVADMPNWIAEALTTGVIDFATYRQIATKDTRELLKIFDENMEKAGKVLSQASDKSLEDMFYLRNNGMDLMKDTRGNIVSSTLNHWVHHRGQLTVYMRLKDIQVPQIYGPSADEKGF